MGKQRPRSTTYIGPGLEGKKAVAIPQRLHYDTVAQVGHEHGLGTWFDNVIDRCIVRIRYYTG